MATETPFAWLLLLGLLRVGAVSVIAFLVLPRLTLPGTTRGSAWEGRAWGDAVLGVSTTLIVSFLLGITGLFDAASLTVTLLIALAVGAWLRYRLLWQRTLLLRYASLLRWIERIAPPDPVVEGLALGLPGDAPSHASSTPGWPSWRRIRARVVTRLRPRTASSGWTLGLAVAAIAAIGIRIIPDLASPAPLTLRYYAHLETLKGLAVGEPIGGTGGWGVHALAMALAELARVDPALVLRGVGAVAAGALAYGVYQTARFYWSRPAGAFAGAVLVAAGGPLLPLPLDHQAGAEPLMLAAALALAVFPHVSSYIGNGSRRGIAVAAFGVLACGLTHPAVGLLLGATVMVFVLTIWIQVKVRQRRTGEPISRRDQALHRRLGVMAVLGVSIGVVWRGYDALVTSADPGSILFFESTVPEAFGGTPGRVAFVVGVLLILAPFLPSRARYKDVLPSTGALLRTGGQTLAMWGIWVGSGGGYEGIAGAAAVLLTAGLGLGLGLLVNEVHVQAGGAIAAPDRFRWLTRITLSPRHTRTVAGWAPVGLAIVLLMLSVGTGWGIPVAGEPVEPDGYVRAYHAIQSTSQPYAWTAVSHRGTGILARHRGRFMDYEFFLQNYDASSYDHIGDSAIPTPDLYLFIEANPLASDILPELMPTGEDIPARISTWVETIVSRDIAGVTVERFYEDDDVRIYRISRPAPTLLELPPESPSELRPRVGMDRRLMPSPPSPASPHQSDES